MAISIPRYTIEDLDHFPDDGNRYEILDGFLMVTPSPGGAHQSIASRLLVELALAVSKTGDAHVIGVGTIERAPATHLEPDILVFPSRFSPKLHWRDIDEHWLAVEVYSRGSRVYDREFKTNAYFALGVKEVWLVDPRNLSVEVCRPSGERLIVHDTLRWSVPTLDRIVTIELGEVFKGLE
ncbi:MAG TPA: Uma2 family endonuclease [Gemmatimonadaceae bacterium]|nr:Uma2 family endonuclease [Gemmatimonadaceae bacterium]